MRKLLPVALAAITTLLIGAPAASGDHPATVNPPERVPKGVAKALGGKVSVTPGGLYKVKASTGYEFTTHGPDFVDSSLDAALEHGSDLTPGAPERAPACADDPSSDYHTEFLYAYHSTQPNNVEAERANIQAIVRRMNWLLHAESLASGGPDADLVVRCSDAGEIKVSAFPIAGPTSFANIITAAQNAGFANERVDYSILLDALIADGPHIAGIGLWSEDDRLSADNLNNNPPGSGSGYAVTREDWWDTEVPLHELGHNQGAVQPGAPGTHPLLLIGHVFGQPGDLMSYAGPGTCNAPEPAVSTFHFDCDWDSYFDSAPEPGEWLESHWNLGSPLNRFIEFTPLPNIGTISGVVQDRAAGTPLEGVAINVTGRGHETGGITREVRTDGAGHYSIPFLPEGPYSVSAERWGHSTMTRTVVVKGGETSDGGFQLLEPPRQDIGGTVMVEGEQLEGAAVTIEGTPLDVETTGTDGTFSFEGVPAGTYRFTVSYLGCAEEMTFTRHVGGRETLDFHLHWARDAYGHTCDLKPVEWVDGTTPLTFSNLDNASATVPLPFAFSHYGVDYDTLYVSTNGYVSFTAPSAEASNGTIPSPASPNASLYPFWDDLWLVAQAQLPPNLEVETAVRTATRGTAPTRQFIVEYNNVQSFASGIGYAPSSDFQVILSEAGPGSVLFQYRGLGGETFGHDTAAQVERGASATIGIENADGSDGLQSSFDEPLPGDPESLAILFQPPGGGTGF